jgi:hypothetical protein
MPDDNGVVLTVYLNGDDLQELYSGDERKVSVCSVGFLLDCAAPAAIMEASSTTRQSSG